MANLDLFYRRCVNCSEKFVTEIYRLRGSCYPCLYKKYLEKKKTNILFYDEFVDECKRNFL